VKEFTTVLCHRATI